MLIDFGRDPDVREKIENLSKCDSEFVIAPPVLTELVRGLIKGGPCGFDKNMKVFSWLHDRGWRILPLPRPFVASFLESCATSRSCVEPGHYEQMIGLIASSKSLDDFKNAIRTSNCAWKDIFEADEIHNAVLNKEFEALMKISQEQSGRSLAGTLANVFGVPQNKVKRNFSAAIEFLMASVSAVRNGAKPRKNNPGLYVDFQLLLYLADEKIVF